MRPADSPPVLRAMRRPDHAERHPTDRLDLGAGRATRAPISCVSPFWCIRTTAMRTHAPDHPCSDRYCDVGQNRAQRRVHQDLVHFYSHGCLPRSGKRSIQPAQKNTTGTSVGRARINARPHARVDRRRASSVCMLRVAANANRLADSTGRGRVEPRAEEFRKVLDQCEHQIRAKL